MLRYIAFADDLSAWFGKVFAWGILIMAFGVGYEVVARYLFRAPTPWAFDLSYMLYGTLFMMAGAYTLSRDGHVRGDFIYRLWKPRTQARLELVLYIIFFFPGISALVFSGWKYAERSWRYLEVSSNSPAGVPIFQFKTRDRRRRHSPVPARCGAGLPVRSLHTDRRMAESGRRCRRTGEGAAGNEKPGRAHIRDEGSPSVAGT